MRRIVIAIGLLLSIITAIFFGNVIVNNQCEKFKGEINVIKNNINDNQNSKACSSIEIVKEEWHGKKAVISIFSNHGPLDEITVSIDELAAAINVNDNKKAIIISAKILANVDRITEEQKIHIESFF